MRLLHTTELRFQEFFDEQIPRYAILSHRWEKDEVSYQDFLTDAKIGSAGYAKILAFCNTAARDYCGYWIRGRLVHGPFEWVWIDTCCIDKASSAEQSEAINSMYRWYADCIVCYAYLSDVVVDADKNLTMEAFEASQWFCRGWTLQELLAPPRMIFFDFHWTEIDTRDALATRISRATGISEELVTSFWMDRPLSISAAEKLSWISTRTTSRREDLAYCLLGLFDINMPLLYGEGHGAFRRLQLEILRSTNDESIFIWDIVDGPPFSGLLATETIDFGRLLFLRRHVFIPMTAKFYGMTRPPYTITNQGLELRVPKKLSSKGEFYLPLNYRSVDENGRNGVYAILLSRSGSMLWQGWERIMSPNRPLPHIVSPVEYEHYCTSTGLFVAPVDWLWSREQLAEMETEVIYLRL